MTIETLRSVCKDAAVATRYRRAIYRIYTSIKEIYTASKSAEIWINGLCFSLGADDLILMSIELVIVLDMHPLCHILVVFWVDHLSYEFEYSIVNNRIYLVYFDTLPEFDPHFVKSRIKATKRLLK